MKRLLWGLFCLLCSGAALAGGSSFAQSGRSDDSDAVRKQVQASMLVTGTVTVAQDGSVNSYTLDKQNKLPPAVVNVIAQSIPHWKFAIDTSDFQEYMRVSQAKLIKTQMGLRMIAVPVDDKNYAVSIRSASFGSYGGYTPSEDGSFKTKVKPIYPQRPLHDHVSGRVYVLARIDHNGSVKDLSVYQVDLRAIGPEYKMAIWRNDLAGAAVKAIRQWTFNPPTIGKAANAQYWYANIPVDFQVCEFGGQCNVEEYGKWLSYVPGPIQPIPWHDDPRATSSTTNAIPSGVAFQPDPRLQLLTPLGKS